MIDNLIAASPEKFETSFLVLPGNIFIENGVLREFALIENIAQSSSAGLVITKLYSGKQNIDGFIGAISKLKLYERFKRYVIAWRCPFIRNLRTYYAG